MARAKNAVLYGCLGCLGAVALVVIVLASLFAVAFQQRPSEDNRQTRELTQEVRAIPLPEALAERIAASREVPAELAEDASLFPAAEYQVSEPGRVILDLSSVGFSLEPGPPGEPIRVEADYDADALELTHSYESYGEAGWIYRLSFHGRGLNRFITINPDRHEVRLILPRDTPLTLEGRVSRGTSNMNLGGLWLVETDLSLGLGDHRIRFEEPLISPMGQFSIDGSTGSPRILSLGNASPERVRIEHRMGELRLDLRGTWVRDAAVEAECRMGSCRLILPEDVAIDLEPAETRFGERRVSGLRDAPEPGEGVPTLSLSASVQFGDLRITR